jgi:glutathione S-transferase
MALKLYGIPRSRAGRNLWCLGEVGLPYELVRVGMGPQGAGSADFAKVNPNARIPALDDDGLVIFESLAINLYLAKKAGKLWPADAAGEALLYQWTLWVATEVETSLLAYAYNAHIKPEAERDAYAAATAWVALGPRFKVLEEVLAKQPYLTGPDFALADLNVASVMLPSAMIGVDFSAWPNLKAWLDRCFARPAAKAVIEMRKAG